MKILIVDDEQVALSSVRRILRHSGYKDVVCCDNGRSAIKAIKENDFDLVLLDFLMADVDGMEVLTTSKPFRPRTEFIMLTAIDDISSAVKAVRLGAYDYLVKPIDNERLLLSIERAYERRGLLAGLGEGSLKKGESEIPESFSGIITRSSKMVKLIFYTQTMAQSNIPILITGESGTGKELMAQSIHRAGLSPQGPFIAVNVSAIPETMFESHLFGHVKGAFTGAVSDYPGYFEQADNGTLFLDEIGELPLNLQAKFLRVLEEQSVTRLGETRATPVNVRIVSATNKDLDKACQEGKFRLDLMYRLKSAHVHLPPLRERDGDIALLASHFLNTANNRHGKDINGFSPEAMDLLNQKEFPGNIRELSQVVENAVLLSEAPQIQTQHLGDTPQPFPSFSRSLCSLKENADIHMVYVLTHTRGNRSQAAEILGVTVRQVQRKLSQMKKNPRWKTFLNDL